MNLQEKWINGHYTNKYRFVEVSNLAFTHYHKFFI